MALIEDIFKSKSGMIPNVNVNSRVVDKYILGKRIFEQILTAQKDLNRIRQVPVVVPHARNVVATNSLSEGQSELAQFVSNLNLGVGLAKPNWFKVEITAPGQQNVERTVSLFCESAQFPSQNLITAPYRTYGTAIELPYGKVYDPITMTFIVDTNMKIKRYFDNWMNLIYNDAAGGDRDMAFFNEYATPITIYQLSSTDANKVYSIRLDGAYPKMINAMELNYQAQNQFHRLQVQFVYKKIIIDEINTSEPFVTSPTIPQQMQQTTTNKNTLPMSFPNEKNPFGESFSEMQKQAGIVSNNLLSSAGRIVENTTNTITNIFR